MGFRGACVVCFDEQVDVIFDDDVGFLSAIRSLMTTTKRPVVLTTSGKWTGFLNGTTRPVLCLLVT